METHKFTSDVELDKERTILEQMKQNIRKAYRESELAFNFKDDSPEAKLADLLAERIIKVKNEIDQAGNQLLPSTSTGDHLDAVAALFGLEREKEKPARTNIRFNLDMNKYDWPAEVKKYVWKLAKDSFFIPKGETEEISVRKENSGYSYSDNIVFNPGYIFPINKASIFKIETLSNNPETCYFALNSIPNTAFDPVWMEQPVKPLAYTPGINQGILKAGISALGSFLGSQFVRPPLKVDQNPAIGNLIETLAGTLGGTDPRGPVINKPEMTEKFAKEILGQPATTLAKEGLTGNYAANAVAVQTTKTAAFNSLLATKVNNRI